MTEEAGFYTTIIPMSFSVPLHDSPVDTPPITPQFDTVWPTYQSWTDMPEEKWKDATIPPPNPSQPVLPPIHSLRDVYPVHYNVRNYYHAPIHSEVSYSYPQNGYYVSPSTIQPSQMAAWQGEKARLLPISGLLAMDERRDSMASSGISIDLRENSAPASPASGFVDPLVGQIIWTDDAEVKQTAEVKRKCYNCASTAPPSWRKSVIAPGKILCNKCGIYERSHRRARPPQNDDLKLRRTPSEIYQKRTPAPLQTQLQYESSQGSPYSSVPAHTPQTAESYAFPVQYQPNARRSSHAGVYWQNPIAPLSRSSPYHHAYANRRTVSYAPDGYNYELSRPATPDGLRPAPELVRRHSAGDSVQSS